MPHMLFAILLCNLNFNFFPSTSRVYHTNFSDNTDLVCTHLNAFFMPNPITAIKFHFFLKKRLKNDLSSVLDIRKKRVKERSLFKNVQKHLALP